MALLLSSCSKSDKENEPDEPQTETTDALTNTYWELKSTSGWGADNSAIGLKIQFNRNGKMIEDFLGSKSETSYTISGSQITIGDCELRNIFGSTFDFSKTSTQLSFVADKGSSLETILIFKPLN